VQQTLRAVSMVSKRQFYARRWRVILAEYPGYGPRGGLLGEESLAGRIVPARFGIALYDALKRPKHLMLIKGADHNDWPDRVDTG
jgi:hypothetical protein